jgi:hypothetical protein
VRRAAAALLAVVVVAAAFASTASPSRFLRVGIFDDGQVLFGVPDEVFPLLRTTNARVVRVNLWWYGPTIAVAQRKPRRPADPADPAYKWTTYDRTVRYLSEIGVEPVFSVIGTPPWANKAKGWNVAPTKAADLRAFVAAAAKRYSGTYRSEEDDFLLPRVATWVAWNEPNNPVFLKPQFSRAPGGEWRIQSAKDYAAICNAVVAGVKGVQRTAKVACGVTAPRGNNNPSSSRPSVSPLPFARALRAAGAKGFDAYAHHPYYGTPVETPSTPPAPGAQGQARTAVTLGNIQTLITEVNRLWGRKRIWITEYGYQTNPPDTFFGVTWKKQAQYLKEAVAIARAHPQIDMFLWFLLFDEVRPEGWQSGLIAADGTRKPALTAFRSVAGGP